MLKLRIAAVTFALAVSVGCDVDVKDPGKLPDVDMQVEKGRVPDVDVRGPDVDVKMEEREVTVPDVELEKKTITVPDVDINAPNENDSTSP